MKRSIMRAAAAILAITLISGNLPLIPGIKPITDFSVSVSALADWYEWDEVNGILTLNGQLPDTSKGNNLAVLSGMAPADVKKVVIKSGTKTGTSACAMFDKFENLTEIEGLANLDTSNATSMKEMFSLCYNLTSLDLSGFDTSSVTNMSGMFSDCYSLTALDLSGFDTSAVTNMYSMFYGCQSLTSVDVSGFDTSAVTDMGAMFGCCKSLTSLDLSGFDTSSVTDMGGMFHSCQSLTALDLSGFDTSAVTYMHSMFYGCQSLTALDLSGFDTSSVIAMDFMFSDCSGLTSLDLSGFDTSSVSGANSMQSMFWNCSGLTSLDLSGFDTSSVKNMFYMFSGCSKLTTLDLSGFDTSSVVDMRYMFYNCDSLTSITVSDTWSTAAVTNSTFMFTDCTALKGGNGTTYDSTKIDKEYARIDKGASEPGYFTAAIDRTVTYVEDTTLHLVGEFNGTDTNNSIDKALEKAGKERSDITAVVAETGAKFPVNSSYVFDSFTNATTIDLKNADTSSVTDMHGMFFGCTSLTDLDISGFDTSNVTIAYDMFFNCSSLTTIDLSSFDTSKIKDMGGMFSRCSSLSSIDLSGFVTTGVTGSLSSMFSNCSSLTTLDLSSFDTSNVTSIHSMFDNCSSLTSLDLSGFDTSSLISADHLFAGCSSLTSVDLTGFDTSKIGFMSGMFYGCSSLTELDLSDFDTGTVTNTERMFYNCSSLKTILVSDKWSTAAVTDSAQMFTGCIAIVGGHGTAFDSAKTDAEYARVDGKGGSKGYLTDIAETVTYVDTSNVLHLVGEFNGTDTTNSIDKALANAGKAKTDITEIVAETGAKFPADSSSLFYQFSNVTDIDLSNASTVGVTDMSFMFGYCSKLKTLHVSGFDTSGVTDIHSMFFNCFELESLDLSGFDTSKVTDMTSLFNHCYSMTSLDLTGLDTSNVTDMSSMFYDCSSLQTLDVSHFDTSQVTRMGMMFTDCSALTSLDLSSFDTPNVTDMNTMFAYCSELTALDLSDFDTSKVEKMDGMFGSCSKLRTITVSDKWTTDQVTDSGLMFTDCTAIVGGNGTVFDSAKTDAEYAMIDGKGGSKGYLTGNVKKVTDMSLHKTKPDLLIGESKTITATLTPADADTKTVTWTSDDTSVATVTDNGDGTCTVEGLAEGTVTITATATNDNTDTADDVVKTCTVKVIKPQPVHTWGTPIFSWSSNYSIVHAKIDCLDDLSLSKDETVSTTSEVTKQPTATTPGETTYTAVFSDPVFGTQTKTVTNIPPTAPVPPQMTYGPSTPVITEPSEPFTMKPSNNSSPIDGKHIFAKFDGKHTIKLYWDEVDGAENYVVYLIEGRKAKKLSTVEEGTTYNYKKAIPGSTYKFMVKYTTKSGLSKASNSYRISIKAVTKIKAKATVNADGDIALKWEKTAGAEKYVIYRAGMYGKLRKAKSTKKTNTVLTSKDSDSGYVIKAFSTVNGNLTETASSSVVKAK